MVCECQETNRQNSHKHHRENKFKEKVTSRRDVMQCIERIVGFLTELIQNSRVGYGKFGNLNEAASEPKFMAPWFLSCALFI